MPITFLPYRCGSFSMMSALRIQFQGEASLVRNEDSGHFRRKRTASGSGASALSTAADVGLRSDLIPGGGQMIFW